MVQSIVRRIFSLVTRTIVGAIIWAIAGLFFQDASKDLLGTNAVILCASMGIIAGIVYWIFLGPLVGLVKGGWIRVFAWAFWGAIAGGAGGWGITEAVTGEFPGAKTGVILGVIAGTITGVAVVAMGRTKHEMGREAYRGGTYLRAEYLAREAYEEAGYPHSKLNEMVAKYAQGKITKDELDRWVYRLNLQHGGHGRSVLTKGY